MVRRPLLTIRRVVGIVAVFALVAIALNIIRHRDVEPEPLPTHFACVDIYYRLDGFRHKEVKPDDLARMPCIHLDKATTASIFHTAEEYRGSRLWKGSYLGVAQLDSGGECRIIVRLNGSGFLVVGDGQYQIAAAARARLNKIVGERCSLPLPSSGEAGRVLQDNL